MPDRPLSEGEERSLSLEMSACEALLQLIEQQRARYIMPAHVPVQLQLDADVLRRRLDYIRQQLSEE